MGAVAAALAGVVKFVLSVPDFADGIDEHPIVVALLYSLLRWWISLWAIRASLMDRYSTFSFGAENKSSGESLFIFDKHLGWYLIVQVWWARTWRVLIVPCSMMLGSVGAAVLSHQSALHAIDSLNTPGGKGFLALTLIPASIWATWESLADRYRSFRFITRPKTVSP